MALYLTSRLETTAHVQASTTDAIRISVRRARSGGVSASPPYSPSSSGLKSLIESLIHRIRSELLHVGNNVGMKGERDRYRRMPE